MLDGQPRLPSCRAITPVYRFPLPESRNEILPQLAFDVHLDQGSVLMRVQTPASPKPRSHPGPLGPSEMWMILLLPMLIVAFLGLVFIRSRRCQTNGMRK